eukprot:252730_1
MGQLASKSKKSRKHICADKCLLSYKRKGKKQLLQSLKQYNAEYMLDIIIDYLPTYDLQSYYNKAYFHQESLSYCNKGLPPCTDWKYFPAKLKHGSYSYEYLEMKVVICGGVGSGKSSLSARIISDIWVEQVDSTMDEGYRKQMNINDCWVGYELLDIVVYNQFLALIDHWISEANFAFICFSIDDEKSFLKAVEWRNKIINVKTKDNDLPDFGMILVATKCDLKNDKYSIVIDDEKILDYVHKWNIPFVETSAKTGDNVMTLLRHAVYEYWIQSQTGCCLRHQL